MYNFRYHLVTICSIFVALALGLLLGAAIASSDLAQSTSDDMVGSMLSRYETLIDDNARLTRELEGNTELASDLTGAWSEKRLDGRTIVLLLGDTLGDRSLQASLTDAINHAGGSVVNVTVLKQDFGLEDEEIRTALQTIVDEVPGEEYQQTLAHQLEQEWSYVYTTSSAEPTQEDFDLPFYTYTRINDELTAIENAGGEKTPDQAAADNAEGESASPTGRSSETVLLSDGSGSEPLASDGGLVAQTPFQKIFFDRYSLTRALLTYRIVDIGVNYTQLAEHKDPSPPNDQRAALRIATSWQLPYGVNGLINGLAQQQDDAMMQTRIGLQLTLSFEQAGAASDLVYPLWLRSSIPHSVRGSVAKPNYYTLLIQPDYLNYSMDILASENSLSCVTTPQTVSGRYSLIALLSGAQAGIYGEDRSPENNFVPLPEDSSGRAAFR
ncbi:MAG: copper transporter [Coriobacteriales bacterium]|jgi:hypothetical protein|nr:copper transporter [Coriobacteriales bacterium]